MASHDRQQTFLMLVTDFVVGGSADRAGRCNALAALRLASVARCSDRHRLASWGWKALAKFEGESARALRLREVSFGQWFVELGALVRSNTDVAGGSLMSRMRRVISEAAVLEGMLLNVWHPATSAATREWISTEMDHCLRWWRHDRLSTDTPEEQEGEFNFTDSEDE